MGIPVLILGESGSGKSASLRNFSPDEIGVFNVASKPLPFRKKLKSVNHAGYQIIMKGLGAIPDSKGNYTPPKLKCYAIDDSQYLMAFEEFSRAKETGYTKFTDMALNFYNLVKYIIDGTPDDCIVYFLHHVSTDDTGHIRAKTVGKMIDSKLTLEGLFSIVLLTEVDKDGHWFITQSDGYTTAKSPMEMFPERIENDLKAVDTAIREYYNMEVNNNDQ